MRMRRIVLVGVAVLSAVGFAACGSADDAQGGDGAGTTTAANTATTATAPTTTTDVTPLTKVSANSASRDELVAALEGVGVDNADNWAREIEEYRPYDTADPTLPVLQRELGKYNPSAETLATIMSVLEP